MFVPTLKYGCREVFQAAAFIVSENLKVGSSRVVRSCEKKFILFSCWQGFHSDGFMEGMKVDGGIFDWERES